MDPLGKAEIQKLLLREISKNLFREIPRVWHKLGVVYLRVHFYLVHGRSDPCNFKDSLCLDDAEV